jgi:hypothetical protein
MFIYLQIYFFPNPALLNPVSSALAARTRVPLLHAHKKTGP